MAYRIDIITFCNGNARRLTRRFHFSLLHS